MFEHQKHFLIAVGLIITLIMGLLGGVNWYIYNQVKSLRKNLQNLQAPVQLATQQAHIGDEVVVFLRSDRFHRGYLENANDKVIILKNISGNSHYILKSQIESEKVFPYKPGE